ncbi:STY4851/ECs_5259 family protein, partial [Vibrio parahaemolyticus]|nr:STY4851/ECs_5259 family protein [Vibrio parahaemolyticus]
MNTDWGHSGWQYLRDTYKNYGHLPLSTFEVFKYLVRDTKALAVALFQFELNPDLIARLESELPVFWHFVPLEDWQHAIQLQRAMLEGMCLPAEIVDELMAKQIMKLVDAIPALSDEVAIFLETGKLPQLCPSALMEILVHNEWYQDLLRQNAENNSWPTEFGADLKRWCTQSGLMPFEIKTNAGFHDGVVYLPVFAAAVVTGLVPVEVSSTFRDYDLFHLRKLRDFDCAWFEPVFRCFVSYFLLNQTGK